MPRVIDYEEGMDALCPFTDYSCFTQCMLMRPTGFGEPRCSFRVIADELVNINGAMNMSQHTDMENARPGQGNRFCGAVSHEEASTPMEDDAKDSGAFEGCLNCKCWNPYDSEPGTLSEGSCRRLPPSVPVNDEYVRETPLMSFPITYGEEWCGEWRPR